jgi:hypothetical protein
VYKRVLTGFQTCINSCQLVYVVGFCVKHFMKNYDYRILGLFTKFRKPTLNFFVPVRPAVCMSVRLCDCMKQLCSCWTDFHEMWYLKIFKKSVEKIKFHEDLARLTDNYLKTCVQL